MLLTCVWNLLDSILEYNLIPLPTTGALDALFVVLLPPCYYMTHSMRRDFFQRY
jgi:hypothetical protein